MTPRPTLTREARERCEHPSTHAIRSDLPDSYGGREWCRDCGAFFFMDGCPNLEDDFSGIDWPATEAADRADMARAGQMELPT